MTGIIEACWALLVGLLATVWGVCELLTVWAWDILYHLHVNEPRLEGILVGVLLAWVLLRRDKHPLLRVISSPLKLIVDILDLAWDQIVEVAADVWDTAKTWVSKPYGFCRGKVVGVYNSILGALTSVKNKLASRKDDN